MKRIDPADRSGEGFEPSVEAWTPSEVEAHLQTTLQLVQAHEEPGPESRSLGRARGFFTVCEALRMQLGEGFYDLARPKSSQMVVSVRNFPEPPDFRLVKYYDSPRCIGLGKCSEGSTPGGQLHCR